MHEFFYNWYILLKTLEIVLLKQDIEVCTHLFYPSIYIHVLLIQILEQGIYETMIHKIVRKIPKDMDFHQIYEVYDLNKYKNLDHNLYKSIDGSIKIF